MLTSVLYSLLLLQADGVSPPADTPPPPSVPPEPAPATPESWVSQQGVRAPAASLMNPALSLILDSTFGYYGRHAGDFAALGLPIAGDDPSDTNEGFNIQEIELAASAAIDPYLEGAIYLTIPNLEGLEVEEAYLVTTSLPANLQIKAGSFRSQVGRNNGQHLHLQSFTRRPLMTAPLFGADGFRGPGLQASVLLPLPWFVTLYGEVFAIGAPEEPTAVSTFGGGGRLTPAKLSYTAVLEQFFELGETMSLLVGANFATGRALACGAMDPCDPALAASPRSYLYGGDLYFKWKPANTAQTYGSVQVTLEYFARTLAEGGPTEGAAYLEPVVQIARRFYVGGRFDVTGLPDGPNLARRYGYAGSITFAPSEFSRLRLYAQELTGAGLPSTTVGFLQAEYSLGAHGAHPY
jgi:hypothetical protein